MAAQVVVPWTADAKAPGLNPTGSWAVFLFFPQKELRRIKNFNFFSPRILNKESSL